MSGRIDGRRRPDGLSSCPARARSRAADRAANGRYASHAATAASTNVSPMPRHHARAFRPSSAACGTTTAARGSRRLHAPSAGVSRTDEMTRTTGSLPGTPSPTRIAPSVAATRSSMCGALAGRREHQQRADFAKARGETMPPRIRQESPRSRAARCRSASRRVGRRPAPRTRSGSATRRRESCRRVRADRRCCTSSWIGGDSANRSPTATRRFIACARPMPTATRPVATGSMPITTSA